MILKILLRILALPFFGLAFLQWVNYNYPDNYGLSFEGALSLDSIPLMFNWLFVCLIALPGVGLWMWSNRLQGRV